MPKFQKMKNQTEHILFPMGQAIFSKTFKGSLRLGQYKKAQNLVKNVIELHIAENLYPNKIGSILFDCIISCSSKTRSKLHFPLIKSSLCYQIFKLSTKENYHDAQLFYIVASGGNIKTLESIFQYREPNIETNKNSVNSSLSLILEKIDETNLTENIGKPIDLARSSYALGYITVAAANFNEVLTPFYSHILSSRHQIISTDDHDAMGAEALALLERAFTKKGGVKVAIAEAQDGMNGGLRYIFDSMTDQFKLDEKEKYINHIFKMIINPLEWKAKVALMGSLLDNLKNHLPKELVSQPPERFATNWDVIVRTYVQSINHIKSLLKSY